MNESVLLAIVMLTTAATLGLTVAELRMPQHRATLRGIRETFGTISSSGIAAFLIVTFIGRPYFIPSLSMAATLEVHDVLLVDKFAYRFGPPNDGDIAVFEPPVESPDDYIKRVLAVPGDHIEVHHGVLYRNGIAVNEPYAQRPQYDFTIANYGFVVDGVPLSPDVANIPPRSAWTAPDRVPANCYLMFGDNRNDSLDSHFWGCAQTGGTFASGPRKGQPAHFTGRADILVLPLSRLRVLDRPTASASEQKIRSAP